MKKIAILLSFFLLAIGLTAQLPVDYLLRAKALTDSGKIPDAVILLSEAISKKEDFRFFLERAEAYMTTGDYSRALADYNSAEKIAAGSGEYGLARLYAIKGDVKTSLYHLDLNLASSFKKREKVIMLDPAFSGIENTPGWRLFWKKERYGIFETKISELEYYVSTGNKEGASSVLSELVSSDPDNDSAQYAKALVDFSIDRNSEALTILTKLTSSDNKNEQWLRLLAKVQAANGNGAGASVTYSQLINLGIPDAKLWLLRAQCYRKTGEYDKALKDISGYLLLYPDSKEAISLNGKIESESGDNLKALEAFTNNLKMHPYDPDCYIDRANSFFIARSWDSAIRDYSMALDISPSDSEVWLSKGIALLNSGNIEDACHDFRKALSLGNKKATLYISRNCIK